MGAAAVVLLGLVVAGCSGSGSPTSTADSKAASSSASSGASSSGSDTTPAGTTESTPAVAVKPVTLPVDAKGHVPLMTLLKLVSAANAKAGSAQIEGDNGSGAVTGEIDFKTLTMAMTVDVKGNQISMKLVKGVFYMSTPALPLPVGKKWLSLNGTGTDPTSMAMAPLLKFMKDAAGGKADPKLYGTVVASAAGSSTIDGDHVRMFTWQASQAELNAAVKLVPAAQRAAVAAALKGATSTATIAVDDQGRLRRQTTVTKLKGKPATTTTNTYSHWGEPVSVTAPPALEVIDIAKLSKAA